MKKVLFGILLFFVSILRAEPPQLSKTEPLILKIVAVYPHDNKAFTQGLVFNEGFLYESTGNYGGSSLRKIEPATGKILINIPLPKQYFAEGLELVDDKIYQLTWQEQTCFVYEKSTFKLIGQFQYHGEGWGLAFDGEYLILSDGSSILRFFDPKTFRQKRQLHVTDRDTKTKKSVPVKNLNELEFVRGEIWANVWQTTRIVRINPQTGEVIGWIECSSFVPKEYEKELRGPLFQRDNVLNGIAFDSETNHVFITGKNWPLLYKIHIDNQ
ncbi:MAG: glutaminyl-peptide cyclotransferase [Planctomycetaceae bacterium]|jgi:glutamine cyclotransferase|nr:glutaminyl-peptide cyclotransferase [Planctomycetaceae bacterium]